VAERTLVVDFDGTITEQDVLDTIAQTFGDMNVYREVDEALDRNGITLHEVLRREFAPVTAPVEEVVDWVLAHTRLRAGFTDLVELARERGWRLVVVSSGFRQLIEPVLAREGVGGLEIVSNEVEPHPSGWRIRFFDESECETCGEACKRLTVRSVAHEGEVVYVGDGSSDRCAAEDADLVFARRGLEEYLRGRDVPFTHFDDFHDVIAGLDGAS
jgi:2-hydroxy-3-keto-5-methylthiopentenyl-1-phosphate phosphatase